MTSGKIPKRKIEHWQIIAGALAIFDIVMTGVAFLLALMFRFDFMINDIPSEYWHLFTVTIVPYAVVSVCVFWLLGLYRCIWRFVGFKELLQDMAACVIDFVIYLAVTWIFFGRMPMSYYILGIVFQFIFTGGIRCSYRAFLALRSYMNARKHSDGDSIMIIGAGEAGREILRSIRSSKNSYESVKCFIDDNPNKWDRMIDGIPVAGDRDNIAKAVSKYGIKSIFLCIPSARAEDVKAILEICKDTGCDLKKLPGTQDIISGKVEVSSMKKVDVVDLLGRDPIKVNIEQILEEHKGKTVMVTGGGGSIGSELCRQIAAHEPKQLIIFDIYENNAYEIEQELKRKYGDRLNLTVLIGSVRDSKRIGMVFEKYRPDIVYHAAAHKHVPLMENSPNEAIKNNVMGTYKTAYAALKYGTKKFVLISTDKAVNPTNIMGASKRICEMIIQTMDKASREGTADRLPLLRGHMAEPAEETAQVISGGQSILNGSNGASEARASAGSNGASETCVPAGSRINRMEDFELKEIENDGGHMIGGTRFVAVRFGNVLGSNGSVIPLFRKQIEAGGPVTVTHKDIVRYFMTIPEAVSLVLQAGNYAKGGEIFVLDMGEPVKIDTLARNLIKLSGLTPDVDIEVKYTGLRPGEKLYEEKLMSEEGLQKTDNDLIHIGKPIEMDTDKFIHDLDRLAQYAGKNVDDIVMITAGVVPTFHPQNTEVK